LIVAINPLISEHAHAARTTRNKGYPRRSGYLRVDKDFYVEPPWVVHLLLDVETFTGAVHDPCCGSGTIPSVCRERGLTATGSDIVDRGFGESVRSVHPHRAGR
jgi:hypothetical protein